MTKEDLIQYESKIKEMWEKGKIKCPLHLSGGNESKLLDIFTIIKEGDYVLSNHRNHYHCLLAGVSSEELTRELLRKGDGICQGRSGSMCSAKHSKHFYSTAIVGGGCAIAVGLGYSLKEKGSSSRVWCFIGDGAVDSGHFYESLCYTEGYDLPVTFIIEDNDRSTCTTKRERLGHLYSTSRLALQASDKVIYYQYDATYPHVGSGKYVQF